MERSAAKKIVVEKQGMDSRPKFAARAAMVRLRTAPERNWSHSELARRLGTTPTQIRKMENGDLNISLEWMERLARAFGVTMSEFLPPDEIQLHIDDAAMRILNALNEIPLPERFLFVEAAKNLSAVARRLAHLETGPPLEGSPDLAEDVAKRWSRWSEPQRARAVDLLRTAEGLAKP